MRWVALSLVLLALTGCKHDSPIVGKWTTPLTVGKQSGSQILEFTSGGAFHGESTFNTGHIGLKAIDTGTYTLKSDNLELHYDDVQWKFSGPSATVAQGEARFKANHDKILAQSNAHGKAKIVWKGNDSFVSTDDSGKEETYTRVK